mgnify:CR=1 FL=1
MEAFEEESKTVKRMVKRTREVLLVALVLGFCVSYTAFAQAEKPIPNYQTVYESMVAMKNALESVTSKEAYNLIQSHRRGCPCRRKNFVIIDVRTPEEYVNGHIENAINLDYYSITFEDGLNKLNKNKTYLIYCRSGRRSR